MPALRVPTNAPPPAPPTSIPPPRPPARTPAAAPGAPPTPRLPAPAFPPPPRPPRRGPAGGGRGAPADAELARQVVPAAAGQDRQHAVGTLQLARDRSGEPVAAHRGRDLAPVARGTRQFPRVLDRLRAVDP